MKKRAVVFTENTEGLETFAKTLINENWEIISAGKTGTFLKENGIPFSLDHSLDSAVKASDNYSHLMYLIMAARNSSSEFEVPITLVVANVIPKIKKVSAFIDYNANSNPIDIKTISLIRTACAFYKDVLVLVDPTDYAEATVQLKTDHITNDFRLMLVGKAMNLTSVYDAACSISILGKNNLEDFPKHITMPLKKRNALRHGANNHQNAALYSLTLSESSLNGIKKIQGPEFSYAVLINCNTAWKGVCTFLKVLKNPFAVQTTDAENHHFTTNFTPATCFVFTIAIKNRNPIGAALGPDVHSSIQKTYNCDPESFDNCALGSSAVIDKAAAELLVTTGVKAVIAPDFTPEAREILASRNDIRIVQASQATSDFMDVATVDGGMIFQSTDTVPFRNWRVVTNTRPNQQQVDALAFGTLIAMLTKSDAAVIINDNQAIGVSTGQTNKKKAILLALEEASNCIKNNLTSSDQSAEILVSDTYINFDDALRCIADHGIKAIIQSGGSNSDGLLIDYCNEKGISMIFTGHQHFSL